VLGAVVVPLLAAPRYEIGFMERTELRLRTPGDAVDVEQIAGARVGLTMPRARFSFGYTPRLNLTDVFYDVTVDLLHTGDLAADFEWRKARLAITEHAAYGTRTFTALEQPTEDVVIGNAGQGIVPITGPVSYGSSDTTLTLTLELGRRSDLEVAGGYLFDGGLDEEARTVIPFVHGPRARLEWRYQLGRRDSLASSLEGERLYSDGTTDVSDEEMRSGLARWRERWAHAWSAVTSTELNAGVAVAQTTAVTTGAEVFAVGGGSATTRFKTGPNAEFFELETLAQVDVMIDRLTGLPDQRLDVGLTGMWTRDPYKFYGTLGHTQSLRLERVNALYLYSGEVGAQYQWTRALMLEGAFRAAYQTVDTPSNLAAAAAAEGFNWVVLVALQAQTDAFEGQRSLRRDQEENEDP
jgi:hypothetical protein